MSAVTNHDGPRKDPRGPRNSGLMAPLEPRSDARPLERALLTPEEAAHVLGIGRSKVYELILDRTLDSVKIGACRRVPTEAIEVFITALRSGPR